jgi:gamma-F420-2:alpha-L-glutamate ligase
MKGYVVINSFLKLKDLPLQIKLLQEAGKAFNLELTVVGHSQLCLPLAQLQAKLTNEQITFAIYYDKDLYLAFLLEKCGLRLFNPAKAIELCDDKGLTYLALLQSNIKMPQTIIAPKTYVNSFPDLSFLDNISPLGYPLVIKENFGSYGQQVYLVQDRMQCEAIVKQLAGKPLLFQQFIRGAYGQDLRLHVVGKTVVAAMKRTNTNDFRANISNGGTMEIYEPSIEQKTMAVAATQSLGLDMAGVDILVDGHVNYLCEVNSNAHFINLQHCTGTNIAHVIMEYINDQLVCSL